MDLFLILALIVIGVFLLAAMVLLVIYFGHPDDKNEALFPKLVVVLGLWLSFSSILILPYDISNSRGSGGGVRVDILWQVIYMSMAVFLSTILPFAFFFYESDVDPNADTACCDGQFCSALKYTGAFFFVFFTLLFIAYAFLREAEIPVHSIRRSSLWIQQLSDTPATGGSCGKACIAAEITWKISVTFPIYVMAFLSFLGWFFFAIFAGVGLIALPIDLVNEYRTRPVSMSTREFFEQRQDLGERAGFLIEAGAALQKAEDKAVMTRKETKEHSNMLHRFKQAVYFLKKDRDMLFTAHALKGGNPLWYFMKLFLGVIGTAISLSWLIHICIFVLPEEPFDPFLNNLFIKLEELGGRGDNSFPLFGILTFAAYAFYLLWACVKGNFKLGLRLLWFKLYPMELHNTTMNSFLFNTFLIMLCSIPTVQFCVQAFPVYARYTDVDMLFGTQIRYLPVFDWFWDNNVFVIALCALSGLTFLYMMAFPNDKGKNVEKQLAAFSKEYDSEHNGKKKYKK